VRSIREKRAFVWLLPGLALAIAMGVPKASAEEPAKQVDCDHGETITRVLGFVQPGDTIVIMAGASRTCCSAVPPDASTA
jgi:hypothetical protein